ncbi:MAG: amidohydrolase [Robiginitomaculum sp.]|nr:MAG: amidohydrolase [Robiginitomaculum sp.]
MKKIDIFNHIWPQKYYEKVQEVAPHLKDMGRRVKSVPMITDLDERFRVMDLFGEDYRQILSLSSPPPEVLGGPEIALDLVKIGNDCMAELVEKYPDRFAGFTASLPMNNPKGYMAETRRAIDDLGAFGVQIYTNCEGRPMDEPEFFELYDLMAKYDKPIWIHPTRLPSVADYPTEDHSQYEIWWTLGWPYETAVTMSRLVFSKIFDKHPNIKFITHHGGGLIPLLEGRVGPGWDQLGSRTSRVDYTILLKELKKRPIDYFRMFYADTALFGARAGTECALDFFGVDNFLFASDSPFDPEKGPMYIRETIKIIDELDISEADREKIYFKNAEKLFGVKFD